MAKIRDQVDRDLSALRIEIIAWKAGEEAATVYAGREAEIPAARPTAPIGATPNINRISIETMAAEPAAVVVAVPVAEQKIPSRFSSFAG
jgi:hypothetical protein